MKAIGEEFWYEFPVSLLLRESSQSRFLYRVVGHDDIWPRGQAECLEVVKHEKRPIIAVKFVKLNDRSEVDYEFGEWVEV